MGDQLQKAKIYQWTLNSKTGRFVRKCLMNKEKRGGAIRAEECPDKDVFDPYYTFLISISSRGDYKIISPHVGKCIGIDRDGKLIIDANCNSDKTNIYYDDFHLFSVDTDGSQHYALDSTGGTRRYVIEVLPDVKIWWNINDLIQTFPTIPEHHLKLRDIVKKTEKVRDDLVHKYKPLLHVEEGKWKFNYNQKIIDEMVALIWKKYSVPDLRKDEIVAWGGYNPNRKALIVAGPSGVGKSTTITKYIEAKDLKRPIMISYDIPVERFILYEDMVNLIYKKKQLGVEPTARRLLDRFAADIEEAIADRAIKSRIDIVFEKADCPTMDFLKRLRDVQGYKVSIVFVLPLGGENELRKRRTQRFQEIGRYGKIENDFEELDEKIKQYRKGGFEDIEVEWV